MKLLLFFGGCEANSADVFVRQSVWLVVCVYVFLSVCMNIRSDSWALLWALICPTYISTCNKAYYIQGPLTLSGISHYLACYTLRPDSCVPLAPYVIRLTTYKGPLTLSGISHYLACYTLRPDSCGSLAPYVIRLITYRGPLTLSCISHNLACS